MQSTGHPQNHDTKRDPEVIARIVNAAWSARKSLDAYHPPRPAPETPIAALERRCEVLEAALFWLFDKIDDAQLTADYALELCERAA